MGELLGQSDKVVCKKAIVEQFYLLLVFNKKNN
jgi:hypothetical protein